VTSTDNPAGQRLPASLTLRVYGIFLLAGNVLLSDELVFGQHVTKFPGGGLHLGEGPADCIRREMMEETGQEFDVLEHVYTTDFFQASAFHPDKQVISIYYRVASVEPPRFRTSDKRFDFAAATDGAQSFRWVPLNGLQPDQLTLPIDRHVAGLLKHWLKK
jgi:8-oxo-dGTP diphosphatase